MKKIFITSFLIFTILITFLNTSYAAVTVTEKTIEDSFNKIIEEYYNATNSTNEILTMNIDKENKQIKYSGDGFNHVIDYDLSTVPTFTSNLSFNNTMSQEEWESQIDKLSVLFIIFSIVAYEDDIAINDSTAYISSIVDKKMNISTHIQQATNAIKLALSLYSDNIQTITDDLFTWTNKKISETEDEYKVQSILTINTEGDFSVLDGYEVSSMGSIINNAQNANNNYEEALKKENSLLENYIASLEGNSNSTNITVNSFNATKLPQTGNFFDSKDFLYLLIIVCFTGIIVLTLANSRYKNVDKK